jgi:predicted metal-dependent peptidase
MEEYRFCRDNRIYPNQDLPGSMEVDTPKLNVVLVLDTSGSMWLEEWINQMLAVGRFYNKKGWLNKLYCCDTALHEVGFDSSFKNIKVKGRGGTMFDTTHIDQILKDLKIKKGADIIYCTDECVDLVSARADPRCRVHVVNITVLIKGKRG